MSGSIGGCRIKRADVRPTVENYIYEVLGRFPGFRECLITGSYNAGTKSDHGDIDLVVWVDHDNLKAAKLEFKKYLEELPDDLTIPFREGKRKGDKAQMFGDIVTCGFPITGTSDPVQIDNVLVTTRNDMIFRKSFLDLDAARQALAQGLARVQINISDHPDVILDHFGLINLPDTLHNQEYEMVLSPVGLSLRLVTLDPDYKELNREEVWRTNNWDAVIWLLKEYPIYGSYEDMLDVVANKITDDRSRRRILGIMKSMIRVGPGEEGTPKGKYKTDCINLAEAVFFNKKSE